MKTLFFQFLDEAATLKSLICLAALLMCLFMVHGILNPQSISTTTVLMVGVPVGMAAGMAVQWGFERATRVCGRLRVYMHP